jgi:hypothetical protein
MGMDLVARAAIGAARADAATAIGRSAYVDKATALAATAVDPAVNFVITGGAYSAGIGAARYGADASATAALAAAHPRCCKASANGRYFRLLPDPDGLLPVEAVRQASDGNDTAAANAAAKYAAAMGIGAVKLSPRVWTLSSSGEYAATNPPTTEDWMTFWPGVICRTAGAILRAAPTVNPGIGGMRGLDYRGVFLNDGSAGIITAAHAAGTKTVAVANASVFAPGDWVLYRFGDVPYDLPETYNHGLAQVAAVNTGAGTVTLDQVMPRAFTAAELAGAVNNKGIRKVAPLINVEFEDVVYDTSFTGGYTGCEHGVVIKQAINPHFGTVGGRGLHVGAFIAQYCYGFHVGKVWNLGSRDTGSNTGNGSRYAEARGRVDEHVTHDCDQTAFALEGASVVDFGYVEDSHNGTTPNRSVIVLNGRSYATIDHMLMLGAGGQVLVTAIDGSRLSVHHLHVRTAAMPLNLGTIGSEITNSLTLEIAGSAPEVYNAADIYWTPPLRINLRNGMADWIELAGGNRMIVSMKLFASSGVTSGLTYFNIVRDGGTKSSLRAGDFKAGKEVETPSTYWLLGANEFNGAERGLPLKLYVETAAIGSGVPDLSKQFLTVSLQLAPLDGAAEINMSNASAAATARQLDGALDVVSAAVPTLAAGAESGWIDIGITTATVAAGKGKAEIAIQGAPYDLAVIGSRVHPTAATLQVNVKNMGAGSISGASYNFRAEYWR